MRAREWKAMMLGLLQGVERELPPSAPRRARTQLAELRALLPHIRSAAHRRRYEAQVETSLQSASYFRAATRRYQVPRAIAALRAAKSVLSQAKQVLRDYEAE